MALPSEVILKQSNPTQALNVIAAILDTQEARLQDLERAQVSGWGEWSDETPPLTDEPVEEWAPNPEDVKRIGEIQERLKGCEDEEESKVLRAELELAQDKLKPPVELFDDTGAHTNIEADSDGDATVKLPTVSPEKEALREAFARSVLELEMVYPDEGAKYIKSYAKGGPLLMYYSDRDYVMGLADDVKRAMVNDVQEESPKEAHEMARDILKDLDPGGPDITVENLVKTMGHG